MQGPSRIGDDNRFVALVSVGGPSQDKKGSAGRLEIGSGNVVHEHCTINRATAAGGVTKVGSGNWIMAGCHVAHECVVGDDTVLANNVMLGGHVKISDGAVVGGGTGVHQHNRVGELAMVGFLSRLDQDVPPFAKFSAVGGTRLIGINKVGLQRAGHGDKVASVRDAMRILYHQGLSLDEACRFIAELARKEPFLAPFADFISHPTRNGLARPRPAGGRG